MSDFESLQSISSLVDPRMLETAKLVAEGCMNVPYVPGTDPGSGDYRGLSTHPFQYYSRMPKANIWVIEMSRRPI